jgi:hypothetical protein
MRQLGSPDFVAVPADYDGDGKADVAVFHTTQHQWQIIHSTTGETQYAAFGAAGAQPFPADFDGDGKADFAVRLVSGEWWIRQSTDESEIRFALGATTDQVDDQAFVQAVIGDFDGDGLMDAATYRADGHWLIRHSVNGKTEEIITALTVRGEALAADFDGDGKADLALKATNEVQLIGSLDGSRQTIAIEAGALALGDYDGDGRIDLRAIASELIRFAARHWQ